MTNAELEEHMRKLEKRIMTLEMDLAQTKVNVEMDLAQMKANARPAGYTKGLTMTDLDERVRLLECSLDEDGIRRKYSFERW